MVKNIVIVGGGSAGWMAASHMSKNLTDINITLIESPDIPTIGVGESTIPAIVDFMKDLGFVESDWMPKCNATYKSSICFSGFNNTNEKKMWYPFSRTWQAEQIPANQYWLYKHFTDKSYKDKHSLYKFTSVIPDICEALKTVKSIPDAIYAYHFDAAALGDVLKEFSINNNVKFISDTITSVDSHDNGLIKQVITKNSGAIEGDLFIDCTGFRSLLLGGHFQEPFDNYNEYLFNNSAVTLQLPYEDKEKEMISYTHCEALSAGWVWTIPLYHRLSHGYVYSDKYLSKEEAEKELRNYIGNDRAKDLVANHVKIRVGKHKRTWVKNCVAVGLSSGFIEPLESTGLQIAQGTIDLLTRTLKQDNDYTCIDMAVFNSSMTKLIDGVRDFLVCHYALTSREDTSYWRNAKYNTKISDSLTEKLTVARASIPTLNNEHIFDTGKLAGFSFGEGWFDILVGMGFLPFEYEQHKRAKIGSFDQRIASNIKQAHKFLYQQEANRIKIKSLPNHYQYLKEHVYKGLDN